MRRALASRAVVALLQLSEQTEQMYLRVIGECEADRAARESVRRRRQNGLIRWACFLTPVFAQHIKTHSERLASLIELLVEVRRISLASSVVSCARLGSANAAAAVVGARHGVDQRQRDADRADAQSARPAQQSRGIGGAQQLRRADDPTDGVCVAQSELERKRADREEQIKVSRRQRVVDR